MYKISYVIPCYYNESNIPVTTERLIEIESLFEVEYLSFEYVFIDDGSKDKTYESLLKFQTAFPQKVKVLKLTKNFGSLNAILAGLHHTTGDCTVILAADLQDPPELIPKMFNYWEQGIKLVLANRSDRTDGVFVRFFSSIYHYIIRKTALSNVPPGGFNLVLFDNVIKKLLLEIKEKNTNIFYLTTWLGFDYVNIPYTRKKREIGKSRWTFQKKVKLSIDSFIAFTFWPIRIISLLGFILGIIAILYGIMLIIFNYLEMIDIKGWTATMVVMLLIGSFQMIALGIIGEYLWRILDTTRKRPSFVIENIVDETKENELG